MRQTQVLWFLAWLISNLFENLQEWNNIITKWNSGVEIQNY